MSVLPFGYRTGQKLDKEKVELIQNGEKVVKGEYMEMSLLF